MKSWWKTFSRKPFTLKKSYHDQNAMKKLNQEKKKTLPYTLMGLKNGKVRALRLIGLMSGAVKSDFHPFTALGPGRTELAVMAKAGVNADMILYNTFARSRVEAG